MFQKILAPDFADDPDSNCFLFIKKQYTLNPNGLFLMVNFEKKLGFNKILAPELPIQQCFIF